MDREGEGKGGEERREVLDQLSLNGEFIGVPDAIKEAFPELLHVVIGNLSLGGEPGVEEEAEGLVAGGFVG